MSKKNGTKVDELEQDKQHTFKIPDDSQLLDEASLRECIKNTELPELIEWAKHLGLEWKDAGKGNEPITRMRVAMAIRYHYFPRESKGNDKKTAQYANYSDADLKALLKKHKIQHTTVANASINRMQMIMKLKKAGVITSNSEVAAPDDEDKAQG